MGTVIRIRAKFVVAVAIVMTALLALLSPVTQIVVKLTATGALHGRHRPPAQHAAADQSFISTYIDRAYNRYVSPSGLCERWKRGLHPGGRLRTGAAVARDRPVRHEVRCIPCAGRAEPRQLSAGQRLHRTLQPFTNGSTGRGRSATRSSRCSAIRRAVLSPARRSANLITNPLADVVNFVMLAEPEPAQWRHPRQVRRTLDPRHHLQRLDAHQLRSEQPADHG